MGYVTNADVEERLGTAAYVQLTDDTGTGAADVDKVNEARLAAEGEVDSYLARRTSVPVDVTGRPELAAVLRGIALDLVSYRLHLRRPPVPTDVSQRRREAVQWLERVARGDVLLPTATSMEANAAGGEDVLVDGPERVLSRDRMADL